MGFFRRNKGRVPPPEPPSLDPPAAHDAYGTSAPAYAETPPRRRMPLRVRVLLLVPLICILAVMASIGALFIYYTFLFPDPLSLRPKTTGALLRVIGYDGAPVAERGVSRAYVPLDMLPAHVPAAVVATEDRRFYDHPGLDVMGIARAALVNLKAGRLTQGGSTLTQQLAKNLFLSSERTLSRKAEELVLALWLELRLSKSDILELYLNRVYFGAGAHGIEAAAQRYFAKSARELTVAEAAILAGLLKAPSKYAPSASPTLALARGRVVLGKMRETAAINADEAAAAENEKIRFSALMRSPEQADVGYAVDYVLERASAFENTDTDEIIIETTLDGNLQRRANEILAKELERAGKQQDAGQAALAVLAPDGGIRALVGGRSYAESQFNRAVQARRQPGSAFKPVVYLTALERGLTPDSPVKDEPIVLKGWSPKNDNGRYLGTTTLREALSHSINSVAVRLTLDAGAERVAATARRLGMKSVLRTDASLALGTSEVSLLDLTGAYGAFANGGYVNEPYVIRSVRTGSGRVLYQRLEAKSAPTITARNVGAMNDMLRATLVSGTGKRAALPDHPAAGKTGTSQEFRDAWFVGYTAYFAGGVWVGNDNGEPMNNVRGGSLPAEIWRQVMTVAHQGLAPRALPDTLSELPPPVAAATPAPGKARAADDADKLMNLVKAAGAVGEPQAAKPAPPSSVDSDPIARTLSENETIAPETGAVGTASADDAGRITVRPPSQ
jgi:penicillin-binding protein 1A